MGNLSAATFAALPQLALYFRSSIDWMGWVGGTYYLAQIESNDTELLTHGFSGLLQKVFIQSGQY